MNLTTEEVPLVDRHGYVWGTIILYYGYMEREDNFPAPPTITTGRQVSLTQGSVPQGLRPSSSLSRVK